MAHEHRSKAENSPIPYPSVVLGLSNPLTVRSSPFFQRQAKIGRLHWATILTLDICGNLVIRR